VFLLVGWIRGRNGLNSCTGRCSYPGGTGAREERLHCANVVRGDTKRCIPHGRQCKAELNDTSD
jgi:hypothetical protein